ncbi:MAG: hypothetical protein FMNOHCHN_03434 [Ignavibacteriaceae bacterium]|nr:hypothetical protein [Ignavibacteriaceae bacterium]
MRKLLLLLFLTAEMVFPQFSLRDSSLLRSLFFRTPAQGLVIQYLNADDSDSIKAGLLAAGNMPDSLYINEILKLPFSLYPNEISFALSKQTAGQKISDYLWAGFGKHKQKDLRKVIAETLGLTGSSEDFKKLSTFWLKKNNLPGISEAIFHFRNRQIKQDSLQRHILLTELSSSDKVRQISALFSLNRFGKDAEIKKAAEKYLFLLGGGKNPDIFAGLLQLLRRNSDTFSSFSMVRPYLRHKKFIVRTEAISALKNYRFTKTREYKLLGELLLSDNHGIAYQTSQQIRQNMFSDKAADYLSKTIRNYLNTTAAVTPVSQEYILTLLYLNPGQRKSIFSRYEGRLNRSYWYIAQEIIGTPAPELLEDAVSEFPGLDQPARLQSFTQLYKPDVQSLLAGNPLYKQYIWMILKSGESPLISTFADQATEAVVQTGSDNYQKQLLSLFKERIDDADFNEALISIYNFIKKFFPDSLEYLNDLASRSKLKSINGLSGKPSIEGENSMREKLFSELMQNAFSTSTAEIETSEGKITVKLNSGIAPFSAGNFIKLAKDGFFKGVNFHRVVPGFVIQAGDRTGTGWGGPGYEIISEYSWAPYIPGTMGMASAGKDTEGSQWFITQWYYPHLQGRYTVFGSVLEGFDTVTRIPQGTYIRTITVR